MLIEYNDEDRKCAITYILEENEFSPFSPPKKKIHLQLKLRNLEKNYPSLSYQNHEEIQELV